MQTNIVSFNPDFLSLAHDSTLSFFCTHWHLLPLQPPTPHHQAFAAVAPRDAPAALDEARRRIRELEEEVRVYLSLSLALCISVALSVFFLVALTESPASGMQRPPMRKLI